MIGDNFIMLYMGDLHFGAYKDENRFYSEVKDYIYKEIETLQDKLDLVVIGGDIYHRILSQNEEAGINTSKFILMMNHYSMLYDFRLLIFRGTRNHDFNQLEPFKRLEITNKNFKLINTVDVYDIPEYNMSCLVLPEEYITNPDEYYKEYLELEDDAKYDFIFGHGTMDFAGYTEHLIESENSVKSAVTFKSKKFKKLTYGCTLFSHIHIGMDKNNVFYPGSFSRFSFGEEEPKGFYEIHYNVNDFNCELYFIENESAPTYYTLDLATIEEDIKDISKYIAKMKKKYDFLRIVANQNDNDTIQNVEMLKEYASKDKSVKIEVTNKRKSKSTDGRYDYILKRELDIEDTVKRFIKENYEENIPKDVIERIMSDDDEEEEDSED